VFGAVDVKPPAKRKFAKISYAEKSVGEFSIFGENMG